MKMPDCPCCTHPLRLHPTLLLGPLYWCPRCWFYSAGQVCGRVDPQGMRGWLSPGAN